MIQENKVLNNYPKDGVKISVNFSKEDYEELLDIAAREKLDHYGIVKHLTCLIEVHEGIKHAADTVFAKYGI